MLRKKILDNSTTIVNTNKRLRTENSATLDSSRASSKYFQETVCNTENNVNICDKIIKLQRELVKNLNTLHLISEQVQYMYNPLEYAIEPNEAFIKKYCRSTKKIIFVGINPGPNGMCQTGVPFGDPKWVRDWLKIEGHIFKPEIECPGKEIYGISSQKSEPSGNRLWTFFSKICTTPENFFKHSFVINFCPIAFMDVNGRNLTPDEFKDVQVQNQLENICSNWYLEVISILQPEIIVAIGKYTEKKTIKLFKTRNIEKISVIYMPHPSPRAKGDWFKKAEDFLNKHYLTQYFQNI